MKAVQTAVVGVTGYAGAELARLLVHHPRLKGKLPVFAGRVETRIGTGRSSAGGDSSAVADSHGRGR